MATKELIRTRYLLTPLLLSHRPTWALMIAGSLVVGSFLKPMYARFKKSKRAEPERYGLH